MKSVKLTIEWDGACGEIDWGAACGAALEAMDGSHVTRVVSIECLTNEGRTAPVPTPDRWSLRLWGGPSPWRRWQLHKLARRQRAFRHRGEPPGPIPPAPPRPVFPPNIEVASRTDRVVMWLDRLFRRRAATPWDGEPPVPWPRQ